MLFVFCWGGNDLWGIGILVFLDSLEGLGGLDNLDGLEILEIL